MRIDVRELDQGSLKLRGELTGGQLEFDEADGHLLQPVSVELVAEKHGHQVRLRGKLSALLELFCAKCLDPLRMEVSPDFDQFYEPNRGLKLTGEIALEERDTEIAFFNGDVIEVVDLVREQILLALPMKPVCREDCKGLCPNCGGNRNLRDCGCQTLNLDPRLAPWLKIKERLS